MAAPTNHWKLGLFVLVGIAMALGTVAVLGARSMHKEVGHYVTYFDESVQGLDVASPIKFRGVTIGNVSNIAVGPDHRHVEVSLDLGIAELTKLGLDVPGADAVRGAKKTLHQDTDLRVQLDSAGLTGVKFLQLDFFLVADYPEPVLPFPVPPNYIPAAPSTLKNIEDALVRTMNRLPQIEDQVSGILVSVDSVVGGLKDKELPERIAATLDQVDGLLGVTRRKIEKVDTGALSERVDRVLGNLDEAVTRANVLLANANSERGLLASVGRASDALGDTMRNADGVGAELEETLRAVQEAAKSIHKVADALEKDPDMLIHGKAKGSR